MTRLEDAARALLDAPISDALWKEVNAAHNDKWAQALFRLGEERSAQDCEHIDDCGGPEPYVA